MSQKNIDSGALSESTSSRLDSSAKSPGGAGQSGFNHVQRPLRGPDIIQFQGRHEMDKDDVTYHLAIPNLKKKCALPQLPYELELLIRLYDENPVPAPFKRNRMTISELFNLMYGAKLAVFAGTEFEVEAKVDFQSRFSKLMGRSKGRAYRWLDESAIKAGSSARTSSDILAILGKLTQCKDPGETLERLGQMIWSLRGEDINLTFPIPTLKNPPKREKRGRRPLQRDAEGVTQKTAAKKVAVKNEGIKIKLKTAKKATPSVKLTVKKPAKKVAASAGADKNAGKKTPARKSRVPK